MNIEDTFLKEFNCAWAGVHGNIACAVPEGGGVLGSVPPPPPEKTTTQEYRVSSDLLRITKLQSQHSMLGHHGPASDTIQWRFAGGSLMARF